MPVATWEQGLKPSIAIVDYGMGNLRSVQKAFESQGVRAVVTASPRRIQNVQALVLPGVGAFGEAVRRLKARRLWQTLERWLEHSKPFMGICLGLQLLFERSEEDGGGKGLGYFKGEVVRFRESSTSRLKVPHMGWNTVEPAPHVSAPYLGGLPDQAHFYFVHSYYPIPKQPSVVAATTRYGERFCSAVAQGPLFACQFHPEKSGPVGLRLIRNYIRSLEGAC